MRPTLSSLMPPLPLSNEARLYLNQPWVIFGALLAAPLAAAAVYLTMARAEHAAETEALTLQAEVKERIARLVATPAIPDAPFPEHLPVEPYSVARAVEHLRIAAQSQSVSVMTVSANERAASPATLGRVTLDFTLRGGYLPMKAVLTELLSRDSQRVVLQQLSLRRSAVGPAFAGPATSGELEAQVSISWLHRPLATNYTAQTPAFSASGADATRLFQREPQASSPDVLTKRTSPVAGRR